MITPMPGMDIRTRQAWLWRASRTNWRPSSAARMRMPRQASNIGSTIDASPLLIGKKVPDVLLEGASLSGWNDQTEGFHDAADLVGKLGGDSDEPRARRHKRAGQHAVESLHAHLTKESDFRQLGQPIGIVRVRLVRRHIEHRFSMARIDADHRQSFSAQRMIEPYRQRSGLEHHSLHGRRPLANEFGDDLGSDAHLPRQIRSPVRRIETAVSFIDTSRPIYSSMAVLHSMLGPGVQS